MPLVPLNVVLTEVEKIQPRQQDPQAFQAMVLLIASKVVGTRLNDLLEYTGYPYADVLPMWVRLRAQGVFGDMDLAVDLFEDAVALTLYANVALGLMKYNRNTKTFSNTAKGNKWVEDRLRANNNNAKSVD